LYGSGIGQASEATVGEVIAAYDAARTTNAAKDKP